MLQEDTPERRVQQLVEEVDGAMREIRFDPRKMTFTGAVITLNLYSLTFQKYFQVWLAETLKRATTPRARVACADNLVCELRDDHRGMLVKFMSSMRNMPTPSRVPQPAQRTVLRLAENIDQAICGPSAMPGLVTLAALERASLFFITWLEMLGQLLDAQNLRYVQAHGEAYLAHADALVCALTEEHKVDPTSFHMSHLPRVLALITAIFDQFSEPDPKPA